MDSSRRAVESYWRSQMIDGLTSDEDKVAPVYKLEEICDLLRSSHVSIVKELSDFILKRLNHKSPVVKQKALRLIKYSVGKSGVEFKREMQRNSASICQLFQYKGQLDPLMGDALNKVVRDTAHEAISAIFASDNNPLAPTEDINRRIEGFGNTNFEMQVEDKKSFLSEVVGLGSASIRQGLTTITTSHSLTKNDNGSYKSPILQRSTTTGVDGLDRCQKEEYSSDGWGTSGVSKNVASGHWSQDSRASMTETTHGITVSGHTGGKSCEERLLETIVTSGGVRLQPTRDALQVFLMEASKLDVVALSQALESKLQSHMWQVRMKAVCVLESILRKSDDAHFSTVASYFSENRDAVVKCSESPQASLREKANKVLSLLVSEQTAEAMGLSGKPSTIKAETAPEFQMPDLIDTGVLDDHGTEDSCQKQIDSSIANLNTSAAPLVDDLFGDSLITGISPSANKSEDDPFADVSFHTTEDRERDNDLFSGLTIDDKQAGNELNMPTSKYAPELFDTFSSNSENLAQESTRHKSDVSDLMDSMSINVTMPEQKLQGSSGGALLQTIFLDSSTQSSRPAPDEALNGLFGSQTVSANSSDPNSLFPLGPIQYNIPPNFMFNQALASQPINYSLMASLLAQQQLLATMSNFQHLGNFGTQGNTGLGHAAGISMEGGNSSALSDIFHLTNRAVQGLGTTTNSAKREETKAFDFISDHLSAARDPKRVG